MFKKGWDWATWKQFSFFPGSSLLPVVWPKRVQPPHTWPINLMISAMSLNEYVLQKTWTSPHWSWVGGTWRRQRRIQLAGAWSYQEGTWTTRLQSQKVCAKDIRWVTWWKVVGSLRCRLVSPSSDLPPTALSLSTWQTIVRCYSQVCIKMITKTSLPGSFSARLDKSRVATEWAFCPCSLASHHAALWCHLENHVTICVTIWQSCHNLCHSVSVNINQGDPPDPLLEAQVLDTVEGCIPPAERKSFKLWFSVSSVSCVSRKDFDWITWPPIHWPSLHFCRPGLGKRATLFLQNLCWTFWFFWKGLKVTCSVWNLCDTWAYIGCPTWKLRHNEVQQQ